MPKVIQVKTKASVFWHVWNSRKFSELRLDDGKDYMIGDVLVQREWLINKRRASGREVTAQISAITRVSHWIDGADHRWVIVHLDPATFERSTHYKHKRGIK